MIIWNCDEYGLSDNCPKELCPQTIAPSNFAQQDISPIQICPNDNKHLPKKAVTSSNKTKCMNKLEFIKTLLKLETDLLKVGHLF